MNVSIGKKNKIFKNDKNLNYNILPYTIKSIFE